MRCIDGDVLFREMEKAQWYNNADRDEIAEELVLNAPTIEPQQRWIPCSERLPERNLVVIVTTKWGEVTEGVKLSGNAWFIGRGEENAFDSDIIAWTPKPEPYKKGEPMSDLIDRQAAIDAVEESRRLNHHQDGKEACAHEYEHRHFLKLLRDLPSSQPEQLTDKEQRIFLAAMGREEKVCKQVDDECRNCREPYEDSLVRTCHEITRKVKGALWMI